MLILTRDRIYIQRDDGILTRALTASESSELISIVTRICETEGAIYSMNGPIIRITDRVVEVEQSQGNTAALPFKQELAVPLEELEDLISEMKRDK